MSEQINDQLRLLEALIFASAEPVDAAAMRARLPADTDLAALLADLAARYAGGGIHLVRIGDKWAFRTAPDLGPRLRLETPVHRRLSRAAIETLAVVAYHQPVTRTEIEEIRGVALSRGTLDTLLEAGWVRTGRRRRTPGRPVTWATTDAFLDHFGLENLDALPGVEELRAAGLLERRPVLQAMAAPGGEGDTAVDLAETEESPQSELERQVEESLSDG
jgi:segregation and condensation protein B